MKIAIVGSGVSGLVAAYHLHRDHAVTVFESNDYVGGHTNTVDVFDRETSYAIDTGFIVFNDWTYPRFIELLDELGVASRATEMSFSVNDPTTGLEYNGRSLNTLYAQRSNIFRPQFHRMVLDIVRFNRQAKEIAETTDDTMTVEMFLDQHRYSPGFRNYYLLPMGAAIWSCPTGKFAQFPIRFIADFYNNHGLLNFKDRPTWRVVKGGSRSYVRPLVNGFKDRIRLNSPVKRVKRAFDKVEIVLTDGERESFDHVVFACHADQALAILANVASETERELLSAFPYSRNIAVLHTDTNLLPRTRKTWASWNYRISNHKSAPASVTYNMNILQGIKSDTTFCVTLNGETYIDPAAVLQEFVYHHPVFTTERSVAQSRHAELINANRTSFCGAYWRNGFHEDGVVSALRVVNAINESARQIESRVVSQGARER